MKIRRLGHAALAVEMGDTRVLIDPGEFSDDEAFDLSNVDALVVTHDHLDHLDVTRTARLIALNPRIIILAEASALRMLEGLPCETRLLLDGGTVNVGGVSLTGTGDTHSAIHVDFPVNGNVGVLVRSADEPTLFHPGDSYQVAPRGVDVLALPMSAPWAKLGETVDFVRRVGPSTVFPIHDRALSDSGYGLYWQTVERLGNVDHAVLIPSSGSHLI